CFVGYPLGMIARAALRRPPEPPAPPRAAEPVSIVIAARNEAANLPGRIENLLSLDYAPDRLEVIVVCNGCTDDSVAILERLARREPRVKVLESPAEHGKSGAINLGVERASGRYVVFTDARQHFDPWVLHHLLAPFRDPQVGAVTGRLIIKSSDRPAVEGVRWYWEVETALRLAESRTGSVIGATGAIYAIRRELFRPMPANLILDDLFVPLSITLRGYRTAMAPDAVAVDRPSPHPKQEFIRKRRTMLGNIQLVRVMPSLLVPGKNPVFVRFLSHKLLRLTLPFCFGGLTVLGGMLEGVLYRSVFVGGVAVYGAGLIGLVVPLRALSVPATFVLMHAAILSALLRSGQSATEVWVQPPAAARAAALPPAAVL
ncbi:MAG TPA: glycosyltransferase family 2 protein, partial [Longimicrobiaceae bacterium]|nr:glycosyltransferase family 2 protein [Longimicrobiaceae bacterium]